MPLRPDQRAMSLMADGRPLLDAALTQVPPHHRLWIALSGGMDSVCLLHLAAEAIRHRSRQHLPVPSLHAVHVNHHLQAAAEHFETSCRTLCDALKVPLHVVHVTPQISGTGVEAAAREARYEAFGQCLGPDDVLWLAHHRNDQAETFMLRLLRGSGLTGLGAMPARRRLGHGWLQRPLLNMPHSALIDLAREQQWQWVDDPSNDTEDFDRNWLRHRIIPEIETRWPQVVQTLAHTSDHLRESHQLLMQYAVEELERLTSDPARLPVQPLLTRDASRCALLIRCALDQRQLPLPPRSKLNSLISQLTMHESRCAEVKWTGVLARIWKDHLYLLAEQEIPVTRGEGGATNESDWYPHAVSVLNKYVKGDQGNFVIQPRRGGEKLFYKGMHRRVKTLLQTYQIPPWERKQLVFVYTYDGEVFSSSEPLRKEDTPVTECSESAFHSSLQDQKNTCLVAVLSDSLCLVADGYKAMFNPCSGSIQGSK
ncbi:tRNA(Ile)-lysidine synthase [Halomonadaceae bacterium LMG 33818]|uniref:tRNA lysidine(34) synthetase TilS n=1 Tax=Cernens ardua TaxID=3402176 RepID=UPI003EDBC7D8